MLATACGYTPAEIDEMTISDFDMLADYWSSHPPLHLLVGAYLGIKPDKKKTTDMAQILGGMPGWTKH